MVKLGSTDISDGVLGRGLPDMLSNSIDKVEARWAIGLVAALRNADCHPGDCHLPH